MIRAKMDTSGSRRTPRMARPVMATTSESSPAGAARVCGSPGTGRPGARPGSGAAALMVSSFRGLGSPALPVLVLAVLRGGGHAAAGGGQEHVVQAGPGHADRPEADPRLVQA